MTWWTTGTGRFSRSSRDGRRPRRSLRVAAFLFPGSPHGFRPGLRRDMLGSDEWPASSCPCRSICAIRGSSADS